MQPLELLALTGTALVSFLMSYYGAALGLVLGQVRVALLTHLLANAAIGSATSLSISTLATLVGTLGHVRGARVDVKLLLSVGVPSAVAANLATHYAAHAPAMLLKTAIALALLITGLRMLAKRQAKATAMHTVPPTRALRLFGPIALGLVLGAISGFVGLLLGSLRLPAMLRFSGARTSVVVGTNMAIGAVTGISAAMAAVSEGKVDLTAFAVVAPLTLVGAHFGAQRTGELNAVTLTRWIGYALIPTSLLMLAEAYLRG
jgi:uncharacterized protein